MDDIINDNARAEDEDDGCRGGITADAIGWLKSGADGRWRIRERASTLRSVHR